MNSLITNDIWNSGIDDFDGHTNIQILNILDLITPGFKIMLDNFHMLKVITITIHIIKMVYNQYSICNLQKWYGHLDPELGFCASQISLSVEMIKRIIVFTICNMNEYLLLIILMISPS